MEKLVQLHIEKLPKGVYLATSDDLQGLVGEHLTYAMSINTYSNQKLENLQLDHKEK
ncbi:hypothetical protein PN437_14065 [Microcystis aeruginosa CS-564/01]|uniref:hypothetical protein n=1 Tax=Microcystis aeruginosa TaxID=1126 RepID=UPI00232BF661|nr:hypothetical protein [Microcystis aeruginosa]MDB9426003.1 hypothetical protein [Microcystis aeruginosa CS-564/01]